MLTIVPPPPRRMAGITARQQRMVPVRFTAQSACQSAKGAVIQLTRALAVDHAVDQIRGNCVCPGPVDTPLQRGAVARATDPAAKMRDQIDSTLLGRLGRPEEIASVIHFLVSDEASFMTGSIVVADGGVTAR